MIKDFDVVKSSCIFRVSHTCTHNCPYEREAERDLKVEEEENHVTMEAREKAGLMWGHEPTSEQGSCCCYCC